MDVLYLVALAAFMQATRSFSSGAASAQVGTSLGFGYLLLTGHLAGRVASRVRLPRLTGYLVAGAVVGPELLGLLSHEIVENLAIVNGIAIALIAATAGAELDFRRIEPLLRTITWTLALGVAAAAFCLSLALVLLRPFLPFLLDLGFVEAVAVAIVLAVVLAAQSPAVVVALADEVRAEGPVARVALGAVVLGDLVIIVLFALASAGAKAVLGSTADVLTTLAHIAWEQLGSLGVGVVLGVLLAAYFRFVQRGSALFVLAAAFVVAEAGRQLGLDPLLVALAAGALVRNATRFGDELHRVIAVSAAPVYVTFFAVAGANLHVSALTRLWLPVLLLVAVRGGALLWGGRTGARLAGAPPEVQRWAPFGLLPQAGVAIALALLFSRSFPELGPEPAALLLGVIALNELAAPALYRIALTRAGEAGRAAPAPVEPALEADAATVVRSG